MKKKHVWTNEQKTTFQGQTKLLPSESPFNAMVNIQPTHHNDLIITVIDEPLQWNETTRIL